MPKKKELNDFIKEKVAEHKKTKKSVGERSVTGVSGDTKLDVKPAKRLTKEVHHGRKRNVNETGKEANEGRKEKARGSILNTHAAQGSNGYAVARLTEGGAPRR